MNGRSVNLFSLASILNQHRSWPASFWRGDAKEPAPLAHCCIALGGNTGNPAESFQLALNQLQQQGHQVIDVSSNSVTKPMGDSAGAPFLNAAAIVDTELEPLAFLHHLHDVEAELGRTRTTHWGPRTIDLDLLFYDQQVLQTDAITVPHPCLWYRRFVLEPLCEIAGNWTHPILNESTTQLLARLNQRPIRLEIATNEPFAKEAVTGTPNTESAASQREVEFVLVEPTANISESNFARLIGSSASISAEHSSSQGRIIEVPNSSAEHGNSNEFAKFLRDFSSAALG